jgi:hypothetical protein
MFVLVNEGILAAALAIELLIYVVLSMLIIEAESFTKTLVVLFIIPLISVLYILLIISIPIMLTPTRYLSVHARVAYDVFAVLLA